MHLNTSQLKFRAAFTLTEMMVVVLIVGIMTAVIIPEMRGTLGDSLLRSTSRDLINAFSLASSRAIGQGRPYRVELDTANGRYLVERQVHNGDREDFAPVPDASDATGKLDPRIKVEIGQPEEDSTGNEAGVRPVAESAPDSISFYPDGTADAAVVRLRDRDGFQLMLQVNPITARVRITEPQRE